MNVSLYIDRPTPVHRLDPRTKIMLLVIFFALAMVFNHPVYMAGVALTVLALSILAGTTANLRRFRFLLVLLFVFSGVIWSLTLRGFPVWWSWGPFQISRESAGYGLAMGLRLTTFVATGILFLSSTRNEEMTQGLIGLGLPYPLAFAVATALRLVPTLAGAGATIIQAQVSRGLDLSRGGLFRRVGHFIPQAVPLFLVALRQTNFLAMSLESRGFDPRKPRTWYYELKMTGLDAAALSGGVLLLLLSLFIRLNLHLGAIIPNRL